MGAEDCRRTLLVVFERKNGQRSLSRLSWLEIRKFEQTYWTMACIVLVLGKLKLGVLSQRVREPVMKVAVGA